SLALAAGAVPEGVVDSFHSASSSSVAGAGSERGFFDSVSDMALQVGNGCPRPLLAGAHRGTQGSRARPDRRPGVGDHGVGAIAREHLEGESIVAESIAGRS